MELLTPFDFVQKFGEGSRVAIVGNAPSLQNEGLGEWIDEHDIVVRFNECPLAGYESDVGKRTTILITNPYPEGRSAIGEGHRDPDFTVVCLAPQTRRGSREEFERWVGEHPVLFSWSPDLVHVGKVDHQGTLTTGSYGLHIINRILRPSQVSVTGFTMFLADAKAHYFSNLVPPGIRAHEPREEAKIFLRICNKLGSALTVTEEIAWVARRMRISLRKSITIRPLASRKWKK